MSAQLSLVLSNGTLIEYTKDQYVSHSVTDGGVLTIETNARAELGTKVRATQYSPAAWQPGTRSHPMPRGQRSTFKAPAA